MKISRKLLVTAYGCSQILSKVNGLSSRHPDKVRDALNADDAHMDTADHTMAHPSQLRNVVRVPSPEDLQLTATENSKEWCDLINQGEQESGRKGTEDFDVESADGAATSQITESLLEVGRASRLTEQDAASMAQYRLQQLHQRVTNLSWSQKDVFGQSYVKMRANYVYEPEHCSLTVEEVRFNRCPPGGYMSEEERRQREARLRIATCKAKERGWQPWVAVHNNTMNYKERGFATFESALYPKHPDCRKVPGQKYLEEHVNFAKYRADVQPPNMPKDVCPEKMLEFHRTWKVASSTLPQYVRCQIDCEWEEADAFAAVPDGSTVVTAVRNPLSRWLSGVGEILQRIINGYCPNGPCTKEDGWIPGIAGQGTRDSVWHSTTWYKKVAPVVGGYTPDKLTQLVRDFVYDTKCNLDYYAAAHVSSQASYVVQNAGVSAELDLVLKLEEIDADLSSFFENVRGANSTGDNCTLVPSNVQACKPQAGSIPTSEDILEELQLMPELVEELCLIYAQDFVCFDYELPDACKSLF